MRASPFGALHAAVDPRGVLIRDFLAETGEAHGRAMAEAVLSRLSMALPGASDVAVGIIDDEGVRLARIYHAAGCSRRQMRAFCDAYVRSSGARVQDAVALAAAEHQGSA